MHRIEKDSLGEVRVPSAAYWGAQTQRAIENFPVSGRPMPPAFVHALGFVKLAAARVNARRGFLDEKIARAIEEAAREVADGKLDREFPIDVFQTGSGTSSNMNANEVIANRAAEILGGRRGEKKVHPNDHVNLSQSSNDVVPTAMHVAAVLAIERSLLPNLNRLEQTLGAKAEEFKDLVKIGRTHLMDATPITLGQEFSGWASQVAHAKERVEATLPHLRELAIGGTAVGTGINAHPEFGRDVAAELTSLLGTQFREASNHFEAQGAQDAYAWTSGALASTAASLMKIANDVRLLASGPQCGFGEMTLPALQPGSSIMPGKVNPVLPEAVLQVGAEVTGNHLAVLTGAQWGQLDLNTMLPVMAKNLLESIELLANVSALFADRCVAGITANADRMTDYLERSPSLVTGLNPKIGYDKAAEIAKKALREGRTVREVAYEMSGLSKDEVDAALDAKKQTRPDPDAKPGSGGG
ncbi:MAG: class II fumarate hydratase [Methanobacteriota archaeon]